MSIISANENDKSITLAIHSQKLEPVRDHIADIQKQLKFIGEADLNSDAIDAVQDAMDICLRLTNPNDNISIIQAKHQLERCTERIQQNRGVLVSTLTHTSTMATGMITTTVNGYLLNSYLSTFTTCLANLRDQAIDLSQIKRELLLRGLQMPEVGLVNTLKDAVTNISFSSLFNPFGSRLEFVSKESAKKAYEGAVMTFYENKKDEFKDAVIQNMEAAVNTATQRGKDAIASFVNAGMDIMAVDSGSITSGGMGLSSSASSSAIANIDQQTKTAVSDGIVNTLWNSGKDIIGTVWKTLPSTKHIEQDIEHKLKQQADQADFIVKEIIRKDVHDFGQRYADIAYNAQKAETTFHDGMNLIYMILMALFMFLAYQLVVKQFKPRKTSDEAKQIFQYKFKSVRSSRKSTKKSRKSAKKSRKSARKSRKSARTSSSRKTKKSARKSSSRKTKKSTRKSSSRKTKKSVRKSSSRKTKKSARKSSSRKTKKSVNSQRRK